MSNLKEAILIALIGAGHEEAIAIGWEIYNGEASANTLTPGVNIGTVTDATELDKRGLPWDSRINATTKTKDAKGNWKYKVGVDREVLVPQVEAELRAAQGGTVAATVAAPAVQTQPPVTTTTQPPVTTVPPVQTAAPTIPAAGAGLPPTIPAVPVAPTVVEFPPCDANTPMTQEILEQTTAALICKHGEAVAKNLLSKFGVPEGGNVTQIPDTHKFVFWQYATNDDFLRSQSII